MDMQMTSAYKALHDTAAQFSARILCSNLSRRDTWVAYFAVFVPSMTYTLPLSHHSPKQLKKLQSAATRATLMKLGFNCNMAHQVVCRPSRYGGLGFRDLFVEQGIGQVEMLVQHLRANSTQGTLIRITLAWWQLVVGVSSPLLETTNTSIPHLAPHWLSSMRSFLNQMDASIHSDGLTTTLPQPLPENDNCIMDVILSLPSISKSQLRAFNWCRIYFGARFCRRHQHLTQRLGRIARPDVATPLWPLHYASFDEYKLFEIIVCLV
jgi:hypothetical protein